MVDLKSGNSHRALDGDPSVMQDKSVKIVIDGKLVLGPPGETAAFHYDAIALSPDGEYLYYQPIAAKTLYRVRTDASRDLNGKPTPEKYAHYFSSRWHLDRSKPKHLSQQSREGCRVLPKP